MGCNGLCLQALGVAYQQLGMFTAALKVAVYLQSWFSLSKFLNSHVHPVVWQAYGRAVALQEASPVFALLQSGNILLSLASFTQVPDW